MPFDAEDPGRFEPAGSAADRGLALARRTGQGLLAPSFLGLRGFVNEELGRLDAAEQDEDEALESALLSGNDHLTYWTALVASWIALARGRTEAALAHAERGWKLAGVAPWSQVGWTVAEARLALGDPKGALEALETFGGVNPGLWTLDRLKALDVLVRVLLALDRVEEAAELARRAPAESGGRRTGVFGAINARAEAGVLLARGVAPEASRVALAGAAAGDKGLAPLWAGRCRTLAGEALAACGRRDEARTELHRAAHELDARGAWAYRDAALRVLRRLGDRPRVLATDPAVRADDDPLACLSRREREVAALVAAGNTNAQIAARLQLSERTVEKHVSSLLAKLELSSRTAVVGRLAARRPEFTR
jgi:DNA-binding CsgD family transcriptional regulator